MALRNFFRDPETRIDERLREEIGGSIVECYTVSTKELPAYRYVDVYRAIEALVADKHGVREIDCYSVEDLHSLLHADRPEWSSRKVVKSSRSAWPVGADESRRRRGRTGITH